MHGLRLEQRADRRGGPGISRIQCFVKGREVRIRGLSSYTRKSAPLEFLKKVPNQETAPAGSLIIRDFKDAI